MILLKILCEIFVDGFEEEIVGIFFLDYEYIEKRRENILEGGSVNVVLRLKFMEMFFFYFE